MSFKVFHAKFSCVRRGTEAELQGINMTFVKHILLSERMVAISLSQKHKKQLYGTFWRSSLIKISVKWDTTRSQQETTLVYLWNIFTYNVSLLHEFALIWCSSVYHYHFNNFKGIFKWNIKRLLMIYATTWCFLSLLNTILFSVFMNVSFINYLHLWDVLPFAFLYLTYFIEYYSPFSFQFHNIFHSFSGWTAFHHCICYIFFMHSFITWWVFRMLHLFLYR